MKILFTSAAPGDAGVQIIFSYAGDDERGSLRLRGRAAADRQSISLSAAAAAVWAHICTKLLEHGECTDTIAKIAESTAASERTVTRAIRTVQDSMDALTAGSEYGSWLIFGRGASISLRAGIRIESPDTAPAVYYLHDLYPRDLCIYGRPPISIRNYKTYLAEDYPGVLLFYGNGGLGKTAFLKALYFAAQKRSGADGKYPEHVYFCSFSALLEEAISDPLPAAAHCRNLDEASPFTSYLLRHLSIAGQLTDLRAIIEAPVLLILDGLNELLNQNSSRSFPLIQQIMQELKMLDQKNIRLIISARDKTDFQFLPPLSAHSAAEATLSPIQPEPDEKKDLLEQPEQIRALLCTPLYYNYYRAFIKNRPQEEQKQAFGDTDYSLWHLFHLEGCRQAIMQSTLPPDDILYQYYIILPMIAHYMECSRETSISRKNVMRLIGTIRDSTMLQERCKLIINRTESMQRSAQNAGRLSRAEIGFRKAPQTYYDNLRNAGSFIIWEENQISFRHQTAREYFCAFYVVSFLLHLRSFSCTVGQIPSFNLRSAVQDMVLNGLHHNCEALPAEPEKSTVLKRFFSVPSEPIKPCFSPDELRNSLLDGITFCYTLYTFSDHFRLQSGDALHVLIKDFCGSLLSQPRIFLLHDHLLTPREKAALTETLTSEVMYYRKEKDYAECRRICEFCESLLLSECDRYYQRMISHQKGKALLYNSQCKFVGDVPLSEWYSPEEQQIHTPERLFSEALDLLKSCMPYNMSANILMALYAAPVSWITEHHLLERDVCQAFEFGREAYLDMTDPRNILLQNGTELVATIREMCGLLLKGHVRLENGVPYPGEPSADRAVTARNRETLDFAEQALRQVAAEEYPFLNWVRGILAVYRGDAARAAEYFAGEPDNYMTYIVLLQNPELLKRLGLKKKAVEAALSQALAKFQAGVHTCKVCERADAAYRLLDAAQIGWTDFPGK